MGCRLLDTILVKASAIPRKSWFGCLFCSLVSVVASGAFLPHQSLWNDEATQLSGLQLNPVEVTRWLADDVDYDFGVPDDRMPPVSYWVGWGWSRVFGLSETAMRWMSVAAAVLSTAIIFATALSVWGWWPALGAGLLFALSPNVVYQSVEIRAYALLMLAAAGAFACLVKLLTTAVSERRARLGWLAGLIACSVIAMYLHFFGVVLSGACFLAAFVVSWKQGSPLVPLVLAGAILAASAIGLLPFVKAAATISGPKAHPAADPGTSQVVSKPMGLVKLVVRQVCNGAMIGSRPIVVLALVGAALAGLAAILPGWKAPPETMACVIALASGLLVTGLAYVAQSSFDASSPHYNIWMLPGLMLLFASGLAATKVWPRRLALLGVSCLLIGELYGVSELALRGSAFAHTAYGPIEARIRRYGADRVALIYEGTPSDTTHFHSPVRYAFGKSLHQYVFDANASSDGAPRVVGYANDPATAIDPAEVPVDVLIVISPQRLDSEGVCEQLRLGHSRATRWPGCSRLAIRTRLETG